MENAMKKIIPSLLWKEWHEQRWKLALACVMLMGYTAVALRTRVVPDFLVVASAVLFGSIMLP